MSSKPAPSFTGKGSPESDLSPAELREVLEHTLLRIAPGARVLAIIPDKTRDDNTDLLFPFAAEILQLKNIAVLDVLIAQGTHGPMTDAEKRLKIGWSELVDARVNRIFDHQWDREDELVTLGELSASRISELTDGLI